nr:enoyl-CoA hydratase/isomerase family protein [Candidatus Neomarinimicrobiota bacterium]
MSFILSDISNQIAVLTINRPEALNAMNDQVIADLVSAVTSCIEDENVGVIILTGAGEKAFVAGADIKQMQSNGSEGARSFGEMGQKMTV